MESLEVKNIELNKELLELKNSMKCLKICNKDLTTKVQDLEKELKEKKPIANTGNQDLVKSLSATKRIDPNQLPLVNDHPNKPEDVQPQKEATATLESGRDNQNENYENETDASTDKFDVKSRDPSSRNNPEVIYMTDSTGKHVQLSKFFVSVEMATDYIRNWKKNMDIKFVVCQIGIVDIL